MSLPLVEHIERDGFRLRGLEVTRVDAFSDVVFGFALTLLVVSTQVPTTFSALHETLRGFVPFAISFALLMRIWYSHYSFFRRFGLNDVGTVTINAVLLFMVLFFVYPLKFLFTVVTSQIWGGHTSFFENSGQARELMVLYGVGSVAIYLLLAALYGNAWRQWRRLELNAVELVLTQGYVLDLVGIAGVGALACVMALTVPVEKAGLTGWVYALIPLVNTATGRYTRRRVKRLKDDEAEAAAKAREAAVSTLEAHS